MITPITAPAWDSNLISTVITGTATEIEIVIFQTTEALVDEARNIAAVRVAVVHMAAAMVRMAVVAVVAVTDIRDKYSRYREAVALPLQAARPGPVALLRPYNSLSGITRTSAKIVNRYNTDFRP